VTGFEARVRLRGARRARDSKEAVKAKLKQGSKSNDYFYPYWSHSRRRGALESKRRLGRLEGEFERTGHTWEPAHVREPERRQSVCVAQRPDGGWKIIMALFTFFSSTDGWPCAVVSQRNEDSKTSKVEDEAHMALGVLHGSSPE
jgi:hypothetical protein